MTSSLPDTLARLQDELAQAPHPGVVRIYSDPLLVEPGDVFAIKGPPGNPWDDRTQLALVANPADVAAIRAVFREWQWHVHTENRPPVAPVEPEVDLPAWVAALAAVGLALVLCAIALWALYGK